MSSGFEVHNVAQHFLSSVNVEIKSLCVLTRHLKSKEMNAWRRGIYIDNITACLAEGIMKTDSGR